MLGSLNCFSRHSQGGLLSFYCVDVGRPLPSVLYANDVLFG